MQPPVFSPAARGTLLDLFAWRRDVRAFRREPLPDGLLERLITTACLSPSVGLSEPWRFVIVDDEARRQVAAFADHDDTQGHGLGRASMPETIDYSVAIAVHTLWLAARLEGIGLGWISIVDPAAIARSLDVPPSWRLIGYLCLGYPSEDDDCPKLQRDGWDRRRDPACRIFRR